MAKTPASDFDIRGPRATTLPAAPTAMPTAQQRALDDLRAGGELEIRWSALTGAPSRLHRHGKPLTLPSTASVHAIVNTFLAQHRELLGLTPEDLRDLRTARDFETDHNGARHLTLQQRVEGRDVFGGGLRINLDAQGRIVGVTGEPMPNVAEKVNALQPILTEQDAVALAAAAARVDVRGETRVHGLVYFPRDSQSVRLAWRVYFEDADTPDGYESLIDAIDGTLLWRKNRTSYNHVLAHGLVFPSDSPEPNSPKGTLFTATREDLPFSGTGFFPHGDPHFDWWAGNPRTTTITNNVDAFLDRDNDDNPDAACSSCGDGAARAVSDANEFFDSTLTLPDDPEDYQDAAIINTFYWANRAHDFFYRLGFDEDAGNFQTSNFTFGGSGGDAVRLNVQDGADTADPPYCNANMNTQADGIPPRLQMYLCDNTSPIRDAALDAMTLTHEYAHGVHSRLLALSGRQNPQEGISDFFALSHLGEATDPYGGTYGYGGMWARGITDGDGIRSFPYSTDPAVFPRTYADINDASRCNLGTCSVTTATNCFSSGDCPSGESCQFTACLFDDDCNAPPLDIDRRPCTVSVHHTGELWANALWIGRMNLVEKYGYAAGSRTMNQLVIDGMKLSPDDPSMLDGRDWILAADELNNGGANVCLLWSAFAQMGMGYSALTTGSDDLNPLEAFDVPADCSPAMEINALDAFGNVCIGEFKANTLTVYNTGAGDLIVTSVSRTAGSTDITVDPLPETPVFVGPDSHVDFNVRCTPTSEGPLTATITVATNDSLQPSFDIEYTCNGGEPDIDTTLLNGLDFDNVCAGSNRTVNLTVHNSGTCPLSISSIASNSSHFQVGNVSGFPLSIASGTSVQVPIEFQPESTTTGTKNANLTVASNDPGTPSHVLAVTGDVPTADAVAFIADSGAFGNVCADTLEDLPLTIQNNGLCPLSVTSVSLVGGDVADFSLPNGFAPVVLESLNSVVMPVRFAPTTFVGNTPRTTTARVTSRTAYTTDATTDDDTAISGVVPPPDINVPANTAAEFDIEFGNVCAGDNAEREIPVCNTGLCTLNVTSATLNDGAAGACDDFEIVQNPFPSQVSHDFCMSVVVRYTPTEEGTHTCFLEIVSDDPDESPITIGLRGTTPDSIIDVPLDLSFAPEVVQTVDACSTLQPFPISNNGICPLEITDISITDNSAEYGLDGLPSFPIILQTGHIAGEGDLDVVFAPWEPLARDKTGVLSVTYIADAVNGTEVTIDRNLCGEGTLTGARVLVTYGGSPVDVVEKLQIQRINANRNRRPQLDTVSVRNNLPLVSISQTAPCASYDYHAEFGTVGNPSQLLPGVYQVNATIRVDGRRYTKSVGFSVNSCDFNPTVIVTF